MKKWNRFLSLLLALVLVLGLVPTTALAAVTGETGPQADAGEDSEASVYNGGTLADYTQAIRENYPAQAGEAASAAAVSDGSVTVTEIENPGVDLIPAQESADALRADLYDADEIVRLIVVVDDDSLLEQGFSSEEIAANTAAVAQEVQSMVARQEAVAADIAEALTPAAYAAETGASDLDIKYHYSVALNGFAMEAPYGALEAIRALDSVQAAFVAPTYSLPEDMSSQLSNTASPAMYATQYGFGTLQAWNAMGYTGEGMRIAIIDTGLDLDHPSFAAAPPSPSLTQAEIESVMGNLNATELYNASSSVKLTANRLYRSEKVPFGFNYVDETLDITHDNDTQGDHGTHVAGIAAANVVEGSDVAGVAPDAQLLIMKVFGANGGAYFDDILAALEDCFVLNADAVNMSLGSPAGFTFEGDEYTAAVYSRIKECDMIVAIAAGNSTSAALGNGYGTDTNLAEDPDNSIISSPATYPGATSVASLENESIMCNYLVAGGEQIVFSDVGALPITGLSGQTLTYVMIPGYGTADDFAGLDVKGKVAVISRGELAFTDKQTNAYNAGAVACLVYDNADGDLSNMQDAGLLPNAFISKASGEILAANADENGEGTLEIMPLDKKMTVPSSLAGQISDFSSWGVTPDLQLVPDVTAPGGNIYSTLDGGIYGTMSGTSMATPHITGMSALVLQYLRDQYDLSESETHTIAEALIMSTAEPVVEPSGQLYSPRKQGAGYANVYNALTSPAYLTVNGGTPKVSMGDDDERTGTYVFQFELNNLSDAAKSYVLSGDVLTDQVNVIGNLLNFMGETSRALEADVTFTVDGKPLEDGSVASGADKLPYDADQDGDVDLDDVQYMLDSVNGLKPALPDDPFDITGDGKQDTADAQKLYELLQAMPATGDGVVTVAAGDTVTVKATVTLSSADKAYMDQYYPNGIYVDGFVRCYAVGGGADLSLPFMGFYGDWSDARIFDTGWFWGDDASVFYNRYLNILWTNFGSNAGVLGMNPYLDETHTEDHNVLSPNGDGYQDYIDEIYLGMMRSAKNLTFTWKDEAGNVLYSCSDEYVRKSYYISGYGICIPYMSSENGINLYDFTDANGDYLADLSRVTLTIDGYLDDGDDTVDESVEIPIVIDTQAPQLDEDNIQRIYDEATGSRKLVLTVSDNYDIAAAVTLTNAASVIDVLAVDEKVEGVDGESAVIELDVSSYDASFVLALVDYGCNESFYQISFSGENNANFSAFYGYRRYSVVPYGSYLYVTDAYNGWHSFETPDQLLMHTSMYSDAETAVAAAEYVDGYVVGIDVNGTVFAMKSGDWTRNSFGTLDGFVALDMALDYTTGTLYVLTDEASEGAGGHLLTLDWLTGEVTDLGKLSGLASQALTLACDNEGVLYTVDYTTGDLYTINAETLTASKVGATGYVPQNYQSMTVDHATDKLYWAAYQGYAGNSHFYEVDKATGAVTELLDEAGEAIAVEYNSELTALYKPYRAPEALYPEEAALTGLTLSEQSLFMAVGNMQQLLCQAVPYYAELGDITWSSSNNAVATVSEGWVTAIGEGDAVITASAGGKSVSCTVQVSDIASDLYVYDGGANLEWLRLNAAQPQNASAVADALAPSGAWNMFCSAAYAGDVIYAFDAEGGFYRLDPDTLQGTRLGSNTNGQMMGLAFSYADGYLYGVQSGGDWFETHNYLVRVNTSNGSTTTVGEIQIENVSMIFNLAIDGDGSFYTIYTGYDMDTWEPLTTLVKFSLDEEDQIVIQDTVLLNDYDGTVQYSSLAYSYDSEGLLLADSAGQLLWIDPADGSYVNLGLIGETAYGYPTNLCLMELSKNLPAIQYAAPEDVSIQDRYCVLVGGSVATGVTVSPWNAKADLKYSISDTSIATVDDNGVITGVKAGATTLNVYVTALGQELTATVIVSEAAGALYGYMVTDFLYGGYYWLSIPDANPEEAELLGYSGEDFELHAGAYYDGKVYAFVQDMTGELNYKNYFAVVDPSDYSVEIGSQIHENIRDMEFDYTTGVLYAIVDGGTLTGALAQVNTETGEVTVLGDSGVTLVAMTVDAKGVVYAIGADGSLYTLDKNTGRISRKIGSTGVDGDFQMYQSMHYDINSGNTYWAEASSDTSNGLYLVDLQTGLCSNLGHIGSGVELVAMYTVPETEPTVPASVAVTGVQLLERTTVAVGETTELSATVLPVSVAEVDQTLTWTSSNETVAIVTDGVVTGVSAGTAAITATAGGVSASCTVVVTEEARRFYAYDETNTQWISFSGENTEDVKVERVDAADEAPISASVYIDGVLYAYDMNGSFYEVDTETFERTWLGTGVSEQTIEAEVFDWWLGGSYIVDMPFTVTDLDYDEGTDTVYAAINAADYEEWVFASALCTVDMTTGEVEIVYQNSEIMPTNLLVVDGSAFFVDGYMTGILTRVDLLAAEPTYVQQSLVNGYWGDIDGGRSFIKDPLTGTIYVIRDLQDHGGESVLYTMDLGDAGIDLVGLIGDGIVANSLFIR